MLKTSSFFKTWYGKLTIIISSIIILLIVLMLFFPHSFFEWYIEITSNELTFKSSVKLTDLQFEKTAKEIIYNEKLALAKKLTKNIKNKQIRQKEIDKLMHSPSFLRNSTFKHIDFFRNAGIRKYEGPKTCLTCHKKITVTHSDGTHEKVDLMDDVINSVHFTWQRKAAGFSTHNFNGEKINGKEHLTPIDAIDRVCGIPGNFLGTGWAALIKTYPDGKNGKVVYRSEGCGQYNIGGGYQLTTKKTMPFGYIPESVKNGIDCLICHSQNYDMNYKYVIKDKNGYRWNEDRTMKAAMSVTRTTAANCLNCHKYDIYSDHNKDSLALGYKNKRLQHAGIQGITFNFKDDVHAAAGLNCTDCHVPEGHKIPRGIKGVGLFANDIPGKKVECENCHSSAPHTGKGMASVMLNMHTNKIACETCHIVQLKPNNVVLRDWVNPTWNKKEGIYTPTDILRSGKVGVAYDYFWFNGNGTYFADALGTNPDYKDKTEDYYNVYMNQYVSKPNKEALAQIRDNVEKYFGYSGIDLTSYLMPIINPLSQLSFSLLRKREMLTNKYLIPLQKRGNSKIYPFKIFNARMYEDMNNRGPYGATILPFDYKTYYETGNSFDAMKKALQNPIVRKMYQSFGVDNLSGKYSSDEKGNLKYVEPKWMRQNITLMLSHGIRKKGRVCSDCHSKNGIMNFEKLGYPKNKAAELRNLKFINAFQKELK